MKEITANKNDAGQRLDKFLQKAVGDFNPALMYKYIRKKRIKINGKRAEISARLSEGDVISLYINDGFFEKKGGDGFILAKPEVNILYEDENIILADKKCGLLSHDGNENETDTLINRIKRYLYEKGEYDPSEENSFAPALCNRIDRNTGGIVIAAKNAEALRILNEKIKNREIEKRYLCVTAGVPSKKEDVLTAYIEKDPKTNTVKVSDKKTPQNKTAVTGYKILRENGKLALVEAALVTGRTHQIRAQMAYIDCPLLGDGKYGSNKINKEYGIKTQALYSYKLKFRFSGGAGALDYLNGREFEIKDIWFKDKFVL